MFRILRFLFLTILSIAAASCGGGGGDSAGGGGGGGGNTGAPCPAPTQIQPDSVTQASLASTDCSVVRLFPTETGDQSLLDQYIITLPANGELTIRMESAVFDAFLVVFTTNPPVLPPDYEDDDGGGNLDALLVLQLNAGTYIIMANSSTSTPVTGAYTLTTSFRPVVWTPTTSTAAPDPRTEHSAVWTGSEMIVWGGNDGNAITKNDGGRYDVQNDSWSVTGSAGAPAPRSGHAAIWTDNEMLVWGGFGGAPTFVLRGDGAGYAPATDSWSAISIVGAPTPRSAHSAVWTDNEMIVWGGYACTGCANGQLATGGRYDPATDSWAPVSLLNAPDARANHTAVWTGSHMIVWGGENEDANASLTQLNTGGMYDPAADTWSTISVVSAPLPARCHSAVWTGNVMLIFGGQNNNNLGCGTSTTNALAAYDPATDTWTDLVDAPVASTIAGSRAIWTGDTMIVWFETTGARYDVISDSWSGIDPDGAPEARRNHTLVWTGENMLTWGGDFAGPLNSGGVYTPAFDQTP
ncbi:MAG: hypothetical protein HKN77_09475 [Woeseiaceae bacterium]|nr:hypothetical protein [Woeseiaceae bacterium]